MTIQRKVIRYTQEGLFGLRRYALLLLRGISDLPEFQSTKNSRR